MASNLRQLLIQRAARLQGRPALTAPDWGTLSHGAWRNRVEGLALGLLAEPNPPLGVFSHSGTPWDWALEVAAACAGIPWDPSAPPPPPDLFGGSRFNDDGGRLAYHDRETTLGPNTPFDAHRTHGDLLVRLQRWNRRLGWDHDQELVLPLAALPTPAARAALWNLLYAGGHARLVAEPSSRPRGWIQRLTSRTKSPDWNPDPFADFWEGSI